MRNTTHFAAGRALDVICLGRFAVDFYAQQIGARLEDVTSFAKYLGGSSANTAFGCARLGLKAGTVYKMAARSELPSHKIGGRRMFAPADLDDYAKARRCSPERVLELANRKP